MSEAAVDRRAEERLVHVLGAGLQRLRHLEGQAVLAAGEVGQLRRQRREGRRDGERDHGEEDRAHAQAEQADQSDSTSETASAQAMPSASAGQVGPMRVRRDGDAVGADAEEHGVREADDAGVAEQQVEARDEDDEDDHLGGDVERLGAGEDERRQRQRDDDRDEHEREPAVARQVVGEQALEHVASLSGSTTG